METKELRTFKRSLTMRLSEILCGQLNLEAISDRFCDGMVSIKATQKILGEPIAAVRLPDGPLEILKLLFLPAFFRRRFPVRWKTHEIVRLYPGIAVPLRERQVVAFIERTGTSPWIEDEIEGKKGAR